MSLFFLGIITLNINKNALEANFGCHFLVVSPNDSPMPINVGK